MKKIVYILPFYEEGTDTHFFYNYELIRKTAEKGDADIFVIIEKRSASDVDRLGVRHYAQKFKFPPLRFLELFYKCLVLRASGYKNFYVHYSYYGAFASWLISILWRFNPHRFQTIRIFYWNRGMPWIFKRGWFEEKIFRFILRHTVLVTGPESLAKEYVARYGVKEYSVLSNWVDTERFAPPAQKPLAEKLTAKEANGKKVILFVHHLSKRKGADLVLEIAKGFGDDFLFLMIGDGPELANCKSQIENSGLSNVRLLGKIPNSEIMKYFQGADIFIMPSREEGSPHVILEAMASGVPFVASDVGGVRELVPAGLEEFLCPSEDIKCFQETIKCLISNEELYKNTRDIGLNYAKNFDIAKGVEEFLLLFD